MSGSDYKLVPVAKLMKLVEEGRKVGESIASHTGSWREKIADAVENHRLHKQAFAVAQKAYKMLHKDELKGKEFIGQTRAYLDMVEDNFEGHVGDLAGRRAAAAKENGADGKDADKGKGEAEPKDQVEDNVRALPGIKAHKAGPAADQATAGEGKAGGNGDAAVH